MELLGHCCLRLWIIINTRSALALKNLQRNDVQRDAPEHNTVKCINFKYDIDLSAQWLGFELGGLLQFLKFQLLRTFHPVKSDVS
jgi:hypothetical protein